MRDLIRMDYGQSIASIALYALKDMDLTEVSFSG